MSVYDLAKTKERLGIMNVVGRITQMAVRNEKRDLRVRTLLVRTAAMARRWHAFCVSVATQIVDWLRRRCASLSPQPVRVPPVSQPARRKANRSRSRRFSPCILAGAGAGVRVCQVSCSACDCTDTSLAVCDKRCSRICVYRGAFMRCCDPGEDLVRLVNILPRGAVKTALGIGYDWPSR